MDALHERTAVELRDLLAAGELTPTEVTEHFLDRVDRLNPQVGAFATVTPERARKRAAALEEARAAGSGQGPTPGSLWGLPTGDKDLWNRAGVPTGFGSRAFTGLPPAPRVRSHGVRAGGAAAAVAAGLLPFAPGSDGGGSIRIPAAARAWA